jgi:hypothetical protein
MNRDRTQAPFFTSIDCFMSNPGRTTDSKTFSESQGNGRAAFSFFTRFIGIGLLQPAVSHFQLAIFYHK